MVLYMADVEITYNNNKIVELSESGTKTLKTAGKYCEDDITVIYDQPVLVRNESVSFG